MPTLAHPRLHATEWNFSEIVEPGREESVKQKPYPITYKVQEVIDKEIDDVLAMGVIEHLEALYASPLFLVKKLNGSY